MDTTKIKCEQEYREATWEELSVEQRVERCRDTIQLLCTTVNTLQQTVERLSDHRHVDGDVVVPLNPRAHHLSLNWQWHADRLK